MPTPLHVHSWYSLLEGASGVEALLERAAKCGYRAMALTDTNNLSAAPTFVDQARERNLKPILGAYLRQGAVSCVALAADGTGYRHLCRVISRLQCTADADLIGLLNANAGGLHVLIDEPALAVQLREAFGQRLWLELIRPTRSAAKEKELRELARRRGLRLIASTAAHFATLADFPAFRLANAVRCHSLLDHLTPQPIRPDHHLVDLAEFRRRFEDVPQALHDGDVLADQLSGDVLPCETILPPPRLRSGEEARGRLRQECERGLKHRGLADDQEARRRLHEELNVIEAVGLAGYFLVVQEIADYARGRGHPMALRGSAGNSLACYLIGITDVNPLRFGLPLDRFLHPGRVDLPDIDLDFDWKVRDEVIAWAMRNWGEGHAAQISTHQFLQPRSAFREAAKLHGLSQEQVSRLIDTLEGGVAAASWWVENGEAPPLPRGFPLEAGRWPRIVADARTLVGRPRHLSLHPGGIVITPEPIENHVALQVAPKGVVMTQFDKDGVERIGLVKIDLLGNRALGTLEEATRLAATPPACATPAHAGGVAAKRDAATLDLFRRGDTLGVGQMESPAMRHLLVQMRPRGVEDVIQAIALVRPAAGMNGAKERFVRRRHRLDPAQPAHPDLGPLLAATEGLMVYEDDAFQALQILAGMQVSYADEFRKRVARHENELQARRLAREFVQLCLARGLDRPRVEEAWAQIARFNRYSFCKSHAVSYGLIAWQVAALKAHHPRAFWTAAINNNQGMYPRRVYVEAVKRAGFTVRRPCVNRSGDTFTLESDDDQAIRVGLGAIASLDEAFRLALLQDRDRRGPYRDLADLCRRLRPGPETLALLIRSGAFDFTGQPRPALILEADLQAHDQADLFGYPFLAREDWVPNDSSAAQHRRDEWDLLGFLTGVPLMSVFRPRFPLPRTALVSSREVANHVGRRVRVAGLVATARRLLTDQGKPMQFVTLEDEEGLIEVTLFPDVCARVAYLGLGPYLVEGSVEDQYGVITLIARRFELVTSTGHPPAGG